MPTLACYLLREDGEWYDLGEHQLWHTSFAVFPEDIFRKEDAELLAIRLDGYDYDPDTLRRIADDIIRWVNHSDPPSAFCKRYKFVTTLSPEVDPDVEPSPITGSYRNNLR